MSLPEFITIDSTRYTTAQLADEARLQLLNVQVADAEITRLQQQLAIAQTARNAYSNALIGAVKGTKTKAPAENAAAPARKPRTPRNPKGE
ncbi:hypothetical protein BJN34_21660 [Cupriavidus necator]|uniref:Uncharacterized protein n=1 Tax=Cupriavidus necator TaxID=106590 RepID=A0A1U9UUV1_CUPNE|nr:DUF6447 family protein [Cupriavidus necator]AQV96478.1 hypothetical protein BJN34_21660 [Cupriavidus necator]